MERDTLANGAVSGAEEADGVEEGVGRDTIVMEDRGQLARRPEAPLRIEGACPFECCTYGAWTTTGPTTVYELPDPAAASRILPAGVVLEATSGQC